MTTSFIRNPQGFPIGFTPITKIGEPVKDTGINFGILKLKQGETIEINTQLEGVYLLLTGDVVFSFDNKSYHGKRDSVFNDSPIAVHFPSDSQIIIKACKESEFCVIETQNKNIFPIKIFDRHNLQSIEHRGKEILDNTAYRIVRTIFDTNNCPSSNLVLGEVINFPGAWSSYPPHHHAQPEIYHYRFTESQGFGCGQLGDQIFRTEQYSTLKILDNQDHAQTAAPGYGMYYMWVIRHLDGKIYEKPDFTQAHSWTQDKEANKRVWQWQEELMEYEL